MYGSNELNSVDAMEQLLDRIVAADEAGLDVFGIGEHHKKEFLDSVPAVMETLDKAKWVVDASHSEVGFKLKHLMVSTVVKQS